MVKEPKKRGMSFPHGEPRSNQCPFAVQINDAHGRPPTRQEIAVSASERRAGDHAARAELAANVDPCRDFLEPGPPLAVVERMGGVRFGNFRRRLELTTFC